ncbi:hypothetical protein AB0M00_43520 [Streptomyces chartreusis]|uniref:hypothetical protein n=1 Tax=Streptomyces chartreusis TaxID=1969 RepID=UPI00344161DC
MTNPNTRQDALQMSRDLTSLVDQQQGLEAPTDTAVRDYVRALLRQYRADEEARQARISVLEAEGHRLINGGQTGQDSWEITDWRTGNLLASGAGDHRAYDEAVMRLDPDGKWLHIDTVDTDPADVEAVGIPESLADALQDWLGSAGTPDEDVAQFVGWSVEDVALHREEA